MKQNNNVSPLEAILRIGGWALGMILIASDFSSFIPNIIGFSIVMFMMYVNGWIPVFEDAK
jgi:hypothetical protein